MIDDRDEFVSNMRSQIKECGRQIDNLGVRAREARASEKAEFAAFIEEARTKRRHVLKLLQESESLLDDAWDAAVPHLEDAAKAMHAACDEAMILTEPTRSYPVASSPSEPG